MTSVLVAIVVVAGLAGAVWIALRVRRQLERANNDVLTTVKDAVNGVFMRAEARGAIRRVTGFWTDYDDDYPELRRLEASYEAVRDECLELLREKDRITDISVLGGDYTGGGIHAIRWKSFVFKSGDFIEANCRLAPRTAELLRDIPGVYTAFFSILDPHQYVTPHYGYYKGILRYHLGVIIPGDNADRSAWLRVNSSPEANEIRQKSLIDKGERYHWRNGEGVIFDDFHLHDAANDSDEVRVVLWLDIARKMPARLRLFDAIVMGIAHRLPVISKIQENARIESV